MMVGSKNTMHGRVSRRARRVLVIGVAARADNVRTPLKERWNFEQTLVRVYHNCQYISVIASLRSAVQCLFCA